MGLHELSRVIGQAPQDHFAARRKSIRNPSQRTLEGLGLFVDFVHEVRMTAQFNLLEVVFKFTKLRRISSLSRAVQRQVTTTNQLVIFKANARLVCDTIAAIRSHHKLFVTNAHQQRRTPPGRNQHAGLTNTDHGNSKCSLHFVQGVVNVVLQIVFVQPAHQMGHFGIRLPLEDMPALSQQLTQGFVIFNDPIVHQGNAMGITGATVVGVKVSTTSVGGRVAQRVWAIP